MSTELLFPLRSSSSSSSSSSSDNSYNSSSINSVSCSSSSSINTLSPSILHPHSPSTGKTLPAPSQNSKTIETIENLLNAYMSSPNKAHLPVLRGYKSPQKPSMGYKKDSVQSLAPS